MHGRLFAIPAPVNERFFSSTDDVLWFFPLLCWLQVDQILRRVDRNGDGKVVCEEFVKYMME